MRSELWSLARRHTQAGGERNPTVMSDPNDGMSGYEVDMVVNQVTDSLQWGVSVVKSDAHAESRVPRTLDVPHVGESVLTEELYLCSTFVPDHLT